MSETIINGIDVSEYFIDVVDEGGGTIDYKLLPNSERLLVEKIFEQNQQLKNLQEENEELKKRCEEWALETVKKQGAIDGKDFRIDKYKQALEEIREIVITGMEGYCPKCSRKKCEDNNCYETAIRDVLDKINEVLDE